MTRRDLAALVTVVVIAVPGLAVAQQATNEEPELEQTEPEAATDEATEVATEVPTEDDTEAATEDTTDVETEVPTPSPEAESGTTRLSAEEEEPEADDEGHGELVSTLARCLPSGRSLHGTGWTKGAILSQVASTGTFTAEDGTTTDVVTPEDAKALCDRVQTMADDAEDRERAKGRPSWAGSAETSGDDTASAEGDTEVSEGDTVAPEGAEPDRVDEERGGPPAHAPAKGRRGR